MIQYNPFWETLNKSDETTYTLINKHHISSAILDKLRNNKPMNTTTLNDLCRILNCTEDRAIPLIRKLKEFGVMKAVRASQIQRDMSVLLDEDVEVADIEAGENAYLYV